MRRIYKNRIYFLLVFLLTFYIGWYIINNLSFIPHDSAEERAYLQAMHEQRPIVHNNQLCVFDPVDVVIIILSSGSHFLERQSVRETWGSMPDVLNVHSQRLFVVGYQYGSNLYKDILNEAQHEHDILYLTVDDNSMTLKELHAYHWLDKYCPNVTYTFKTEDDLFINTFLLHELIRELKTKPDQYEGRTLHNSSLDTLFLAQLNPDAHTFLFGWAFQPGKPERNASVLPYYVSYNEYSKELYPRYCSGFGYLMDAKTRELLTHKGFKHKYPFRFSDIFITGILPEEENFICDILPFTYNQGTTDQCINLIKQYNKQDAKQIIPPLLVCSTGRHVAQNTFSDYYRIWTVLKFVYNDRINVKQNS